MFHIFIELSHKIVIDRQSSIFHDMIIEILSDNLHHKANLIFYCCSVQHTLQLSIALNNTRAFMDGLTILFTVTA